MTEQRNSERQFGHFLKPTEAVKATVPIMEVAPRYVDLQRQGGNYLGLCPFHQERTPSFYIYADTNRFYCFGCQESGDVLDLHRRCGHFGTLWEAVVALAVEFDVELPRRSNRWHRWADEKGSRRHMAEEALTRSYQRRYLRSLANTSR